MQKFIFLSLVIILLSFIKPKQGPNFGQLNTLAGGTWTMKTSRGTICEQWEKKNYRVLTGRSFRVNATGTDTAWLENLELIANGDTIIYNSQVNGQNNGSSVPFALIESKNGQFIFSNPAHDFPQRIIYHFITKDSIHAWIDGKINGKERKSDFYYSRK